MRGMLGTYVPGKLQACVCRSERLRSLDSVARVTSSNLTHEKFGGK